MNKTEIRKILKEIAQDYIKNEHSSCVNFHLWLACKMPLEQEEVWSADKLKEGDEYWFIGDKGYPVFTDWYKTTGDKYRLKTNNIYQTRELAQEALNKIMEK